MFGGNRENILTLPMMAYPNQSYDSILTPAPNQQLLVTSISARNGGFSYNKIALAHTIQTPALILPAAPSAGSYMIQSTKRFNMVAFTLTTADTSGAVFSYQYWNGSTWNTLTLVNTPDFTILGSQAIVFTMPLDMAQTVSTGSYAIRINTSLTSNYVFGGVKVAKTLAYEYSVAPHQIIEVTFQRPLLLAATEQIIGFFAFPSASNSMDASYQINP